jgi:hypothetical protein
MSTQTKSADARAREYADEAITTIRDIMIDPFTEAKDRLRAAETLLDRGHGKAAQAVISVPATRRMAAQLAQMEDEALLAIIAEERLPSLPAPEPAIEPVIEAEFEPIDPLLL